MKAICKAFKKVEYELPIFLILAFKLSYEQLRSNGVSFLIVCIVVTAFLGKILRRTDNSERIYCIFFIAVLLSGDMMKTLFMPSFTFTYVLFVKLASLLCFLLAVLVIRKPVPLFRKPFFKFSIPVLCVLGILASPGFSFFFVPVLLLLMAFEKYKSGENGFDFAYMSTWLIPLLISAYFIVLSISGGQKYMGVIDIGFVLKVLDWGGIVKVTAVVLPLIIIFAVLWTGAYKKAADKRLKRIVMFCMLEPVLVVLLNIFLYYSVSDGWKFYIFAAFFTQFCLLLYFWDSREKAIAESAKNIGGFFKKNPVLLLAVIIYLIKIADVIYKI